MSIEQDALDLYEQSVINLEKSPRTFITREELGNLPDDVEYFAALRNPAGEVLDHYGHSHFAVVVFHKLLGKGSKDWETGWTVSTEYWERNK